MTEASAAATPRTIAELGLHPGHVEGWLRYPQTQAPLLALVMTHITLCSEIELVQQRILTSTLKSNFSRVARLLDELRPSRKSTTMAMSRLLRRERAIDAKRIVRAWDDKGIGLVIEQRDSFAHWPWNSLLGREDALVLATPYARKGLDAGVREAIRRKRRIAPNAPYVIVPSLDGTLAWLYTSVELESLVTEAREALDRAKDTLALANAKRPRTPEHGELRRQQRTQLEAWRNQPPLPCHRAQPSLQLRSRGGEVPPQP